MRFKLYDLSNERGTIWQKPSTLDVRLVNNRWWSLHRKKWYLQYSNIGADTFEVTEKSFRQWIRRNNAKKIGIYDFGRRKTRILK